MMRFIISFLFIYTSIAYSNVNPPIANVYSISSTYQKLLVNYPNVTLPELSLPSNITLNANVPFKKVKNRDLTLDLYSLKLVENKQPLIMLIHGGGWGWGQPDLMRPLAIGLAKHGYVVATPSYRLSGEAKYPVAVYDLIDGLTWLKGHAEIYNIDTDKIVLAGTSAGGQLAALLAYSGGQLQNQPLINNKFKVQALLNIDGLSDFTSPEALPFENDPNKNPSAAGAWFGGRYEDVPHLWEEASPYFYINENSPPTLFINGEKNRFHAGRNATIGRLTQLKIKSAVIKLDKAPHSFWLLNPWVEPTIVACVNFLANELSQ